MSASCKSFQHGVGDVEDAAWHLLCEVQSAVADEPEDRLFVEQLMTPVQGRMPISTPGAPYTKASAGDGGDGVW